MSANLEVVIGSAMKSRASCLQAPPSAVLDGLFQKFDQKLMWWCHSLLHGSGLVVDKGNGGDDGNSHGDGVGRHR